MGFILAMLPFLVILAGIALFKQSGLRMAVIGLVGVTALAVAYFKTSPFVALAGAWYGFLKALGISVAIIFTMYMIFIMKEVGALDVISRWIKKLVVGKETQALFIGVGFGAFLTSLGVVTPAKINNAVMTIETQEPLESLVMRKHFLVAVCLTVAVNILAGFFVSIGL